MSGERLLRQDGNDPNAPPPKDGLTRYYDTPQQGKGWNRRPTQVGNEKWPMCGVGNHKMLCGECTKCGRLAEAVEAQANAPAQ